MPKAGGASWYSRNSVWVIPLVEGIPLGIVLTLALAAFLFLSLKLGWNVVTAAILVPSGIALTCASVAGIAGIPKMKADAEDRKRKEGAISTPANNVVGRRIDRSVSLQAPDVEPALSREVPAEAWEAPPDGSPKSVCLRCGRTWSALRPQPKSCPRCRSQRWMQDLQVGARNSYEILQISSQGPESVTLALKLQFAEHRPNPVIDGQLYQDLRARADGLGLSIAGLRGYFIVFDRSSSGLWTIQDLEGPRLPR